MTTSEGSGGISGGVFDVRDLVAAVDNLSHRRFALAKRVRNDGVMTVSVLIITAGAENSGENAAVGERYANGFAEVGLNLLIGHAREIAPRPPKVSRAR